MTTLCSRPVPLVSIAVPVFLGMVALIAPGGASADMMWTPDERLTEDGASSRYPGVATDRGGSVHIVWEDTRDGNNEIYYKRWNGVSWTSDERLTNAVGFSGGPEVAADPSGNIHVLWVDDRDPYIQPQVYYKRWNGISWTADERISNYSGQWSNGAVIADSGGSVHGVFAVWLNNYELYYKRWDGASWSADERITNAPGQSTLPVLAADCGGNVHVVWQDNRDGNDEIYYKRWSGVSWTPDERLTNDGAESRNPAVAADPSGNIHVLWHDNRDGHNEIYYKRWDGVSWTPDARLTNAESYSEFPTGAADPDGNVYVLYKHLLSPREIRCKQWDGLSWTPDEVVTNVGNGFSFPIVAADGVGNLHLVWEDTDDGNYEIYYKRGGPSVAGMWDQSHGRSRGLLVRVTSPSTLAGPATRIAFLVPTQSWTTLTIFDFSGRCVARLLDELIDGGEHEVIWSVRGENGARLPSGVYFCRLESAGKSATGRTVMVK